MLTDDKTKAPRAGEASPAGKAAPAADAPAGPVTAPRDKVISLRADDRGAAPRDHEPSVSLADANRAFFETAEAHGKQAEHLVKAAATAVASELKKKL